MKLCGRPQMYIDFNWCQPVSHYF